MIDIQNKYNYDKLESYRQIMDPACDDTINDLFSSKSFEEYREILKNMVSNDSLQSKTLDPIIYSFLNSNLHLPFEQYDFRMFRKAYKVWKRDGIKFIYILFFRSLPYTYMAEKPAHVLKLTKLLKEHPERRIIETAQFIFDVMEDGWWKPEKSGKLTALKIRMLHSTIRYLLLKNLKEEINDPKIDKWNPEWGMPISQEDLIATNQVFSLEFIKGMEILGHPLKQDEQEAWYHTWKVIGKIMGIQDDLLSDNIEEAWSLQKSIYNHLFENNDHTSGIILGQALVTTLSKFLISERLVLHQMKNMIKDDDHPEIFNKIFGPTYKNKHPLLFKDIPADHPLNEQHENELHIDHHQELTLLHNKLKNIREEDGSLGANKNIIGRYLKKFLSLMGDILHNKFKIDTPIRRKRHLIDLHLEKTWKVLNKHKPHSAKSPNGAIFKQEVMQALSGIILGQLCKEFRIHKLTEFRIPHDIQENWSLKHR